MNQGISRRGHKRANASAPPLFNLPENFKAKDKKPCTLYFLYYNVHVKQSCSFDFFKKEERRSFDS